jgi:glucose-1-phosphate thymidylyltransferase
VTTRIDGEVDEKCQIVGPAVVEQGAKVTRSAILGPAVIGRDTIVEDSVIGAYASIHDECEVRGSQIEDSIIMERCRIEEVEGLAQSLLGKDVAVRRGKRRPPMYRVMLGDQSQIEVL